MLKTNVLDKFRDLSKNQKLKVRRIDERQTFEYTKPKIVKIK